MSVPAGRRRHAARGGGAGAAAGGERIQWADTAKGVCILLVVLWHVVAKHYLQIEWKIGLPVPGAWGALGEALLPLRMPLFFTISGMFAAGAVLRPWRMVARSRVAKFLYLYALWLMIHTAWLSLNPGFPTDRATSVLGLVEQLTISPSNLWYLFALAVYFTIAKVTRGLPPALVLVPALALSVAAAAELLPVAGNRAGLYQNLVFFLAGLYFRPLVERVTARARGRDLLLTGAAYGLVLLAITALGAKTWPGVWPAASVVATLFGLIAAAMMCRVPLISRPLSALGRRTLPIYVIHMPVLAMLDLVLAGPLARLGAPWSAIVALAEPVLLTALIAWICLMLDGGLRRVRADRVLLDLPGGAPAGRHAQHPRSVQPVQPVPPAPPMPPAQPVQPVRAAQPGWSPARTGDLLQEPPYEVRP
ncbi:putative membrane protein YcfT [Thermocatellispora tengchongensis]|uniref:Putative membrane protein YcfT n=1 Tax=Thermocatellispora tengchongensis TaxID=1073253 RepID=A0A840P7D1_9ACTN|nr:acyltransferase [Thermocatellispora tengchongensis]MBB5131925.1 putative membrane protein YcfT [Thermocatellispora tengchongensis]